MANNSILKLQVDDKQYEASLKNAQQGLKALQDALRNSGKSFADVDKQTEEYVRELGQMNTTAKTARGGISEMSSAFVELSRVEKQLTDQERQSPVGKALTESLAQLKQRTIDAKNELQGLENQLKNVGDIKLPDTSSGLFGGGKLDGMLQIFGGNMMTKAAGWATDFAVELGDAVKQGIELARQGEGIRIAFERLGRGDILDGLREATHGTVTDLELMKAAVKFNDFKLPVEELGTMLAFAQQKAKDTGQSVDYMVDSIVTGLGRKSLMILDNLGLSANEIKEKMKETGDMTKAVGAIIREQMEKAGDYVETAADRAAQANVSLQNKMEELGRKFAPLEEASNSLWTSMKIGILDVVGGPLTNLLNKLTEAGRLMNAYGRMGGSDKVGRMISNLASASEGKRQSIYQQQKEKFWRYINPREQQIKDIRAWQSGERNEALQKRVGAITEKYGSLDATKIQAEVDAAKKMLADYQKSAQQILQPIKQDIEPNIVDDKGGHSGKGGSGGTTKAEVQAVSGSIDEQTKRVQELQKAWRAAADDDSRQKIKTEIEEQQYVLDRMTGKEKFDPTKMQQITDLSGRTPWATSEMLTKGAELTLPVKLDIESPESKLRGELERLQELLKNAWTNAERDALKDAIDNINGQLDDMSGKNKKKKGSEEGGDYIDDTSKVVSGLNSVASGLQQMGIKLPDGVQKIMGVAQGLMTVIQGVQSIIGIFTTTTATAQTTATSANSIAVSTNTGAIATLAGAVTANTTALVANSATNFIGSYANGGIVPHAANGYFVPGSHYSGDVTPIMANAGELVLSRSQQGVLAAALEGNNGRNVNITGVLRGEDIVLVADTWGKRTGRGELLFAKNL